MEAPTRFPAVPKQPGNQRSWVDVSSLSQSARDAHDDIQGSPALYRYIN